MIYTIDNIVFVKKNNTVNVIVNGKAVDAFTNYEIKNENEFKKACNEYINEN